MQRDLLKLLTVKFSTEDYKVIRWEAACNKIAMGAIVLKAACGKGMCELSTESMTVENYDSKHSISIFVTIPDHNSIKEMSRVVGVAMGDLVRSFTRCGGLRKEIKQFASCEAFNES